MGMIALQYGERFDRWLHYVDGPYYCSVMMTACGPLLRSFIYPGVAAQAVAQVYKKKVTFIDVCQIAGER